MPSEELKNQDKDKENKESKESNKNSGTNIPISHTFSFCNKVFHGKAKDLSYD
ncbi:MAG: hypothetical protein ACKOAD_03280 [Gammaproteobacteria bacterium]